MSAAIAGPSSSNQTKWLSAPLPTCSACLSTEAWAWASVNSTPPPRRPAGHQSRLRGFGQEPLHVRPALQIPDVIDKALARPHPREQDRPVLGRRQAIIVLRD